ncbi:hypothetical protein CK203_061763 [Vitis vinifera]|uniref:Uncharacterized protein n=1 Tax=Vitis vinifera TaxID=29760 RepID=A0A438GSP1_VITVI|nr:hypothetical protein CK203_061763 [Vitis vinifera]
MPLGASFKSTSVWDGVEDRFRKRLGMWKRQYLSKEEDDFNSKHVIESTNLSYVFVVFTKCSQTETGKDSKGFPLGGGNLERKPHLVRWEVVCLSKKKEGLGVKNLSILNKALLANGIGGSLMREKLYGIK